ncbi:MAG: hypothetical protein HC930_10820 [Hydrococcus sp. SU_1_0]|nr:hypothetical protein [Hydrococcus sp. SU_1_0]
MKLRLRSKITFLFLTFFFVVISNKIVVSKTVIPVSNSENYLISQNFLDIDFGGNYYSKMLEADRFYKQGNLVKVKQIQREVKPDFPQAQAPPVAQADLSQLNPPGQQYWQTANQGIQANPEGEDEINSQIFDPLENLVAEYPEFVPGHILLANTYALYDDKEDALSVIEQASAMYPGRDDVLDTKLKLLLEFGEPLEASIAAREFAASYPDFHKTPAYKQAADEYFEQYQGNLNPNLLDNKSWCQEDN